MNEMEIIEKLPIKVSIEKGWTGHYFTINIPPMTMTYETFLRLGSNLSKDEIEYGKKEYGIVYPQDIETYHNDVSISHYDYTNGECNFSASSKKDIENWLQLHKKYVYSDNL